jgi:hypothetical protein
MIPQVRYERIESSIEAFTQCHCSFVLFRDLAFTYCPIVLLFAYSHYDVRIRKTNNSAEQNLCYYFPVQIFLQHCEIFLITYDSNRHEYKTQTGCRQHCRARPQQARSRKPRSLTPIKRRRRYAAQAQSQSSPNDEQAQEQTKYRQHCSQQATTSNPRILAIIERRGRPSAQARSQSTPTEYYTRVEYREHCRRSLQRSSRSEPRSLASIKRRGRHAAQARS